MKWLGQGIGIRDSQQAHEPVVRDLRGSLPALSATPEVCFHHRHCHSIKPAQDESFEDLRRRDVQEVSSWLFPLSGLQALTFASAADMKESGASVESFHGSSKKIHQTRGLLA